MSAFVITRTNGIVGSHIDHLSDPKRQPSITEEIRRIPLSEGEATLSLDKLRKLFADEIAAVIDDTGVLIAPTPSHFDDDDYHHGYQLGLEGAPDQNISWAGWRGWRDGAADRGFLPLCTPFGVG